MSKENWLIYPTVDLFIYDLADGIGQNEDKISQNRELFLQKIYGDNISAVQREQLKQAETEISDYIELLNDPNIAEFEPPLDGYAYPIKLGDTYAVQFDFSGNRELEEDKQLAPKEIDCLESLKQEVISRINSPATIGQSWFISGQLTADDQDALASAKNCYTKLNLFPNAVWDRDLQTEGQFLGANFYELWHPPGDKGNISQNHHVLICLFPYNSGQSILVLSKTFDEFYTHLIRLFAYRNKVIWAYTQSRQLKASLKESSGKIQQFVNRLLGQVNASKVDLKELQKNLVDFLTISSAYASNISGLEQQENTIKTNLRNYQIRLKTISQKMGTDAKDFKFMGKFSIFVKDKYVWQVESDNRSLSPGLRLLENAIQTIEGIIEIERAKSDRTLNVTIGAVGAGMATSGVFASTYASQINSPASDKNPMDVNAVFGLSMGLGILVGAIVFIVIRKKWR
jgi:hypothetical protein